MQEIKLAAKSAAKKLVKVTQAKLIFIMTTTTVHNNPGVDYNQWEEQYVSNACVNFIKKTSKILEQSEWQNSATQSIIEYKETFSAIGREGATLTIVSGNNFSNGLLVGNEKTYKVINGLWVCTKV